MELYQHNLNLLHKYDPDLAEKVMQASIPEWIEIVQAKDGNPALKVLSAYLHSAYRPIEEAFKITSRFEPDEGKRTVIYGLGLGYHVLEILRKSKGDVAVIEPSLQIFRAFLSSMDITPFIERTRFIVAEPPEKILSRLLQGEWNIFKHSPSVKISEKYFNLLDRGRELTEILKNQSLKIMVVNPIYGGSLPTAHNCAQAFKNMGHKVTTVDCENISQGYSWLRNITRNPQNGNSLSNSFIKLMGDSILAQAADFKPDLILALAQAPLSPQSIEDLKQVGCPVAFWFVEDFRTLTYWQDIVSSYDYFFSIQKGEALDSFKMAGGKNCYQLPQACAPWIQKPVMLKKRDRKKYSADLSFMGAAYYNRQQSFPQLLDFNFKIWGTEWQLDSPLGKHVQNANRLVSRTEAVKIYNSAKININLHSSTFHAGINPEGDFINPRTFEIAACSGFQLVDHRSELSEMFHIGKEMITFSSMADLREKCHYYLNNDAERSEIANRAFLRANMEHSVEHRMQEILLHIFTDQLDSLKSRLSGRQSPLEFFIEKAEEGSELREYLNQFPTEKEFSLKTVVDHIGNGEGALSDNEIVMLMLDHVVEEKF